MSHNAYIRQPDQAHPVEQRLMYNPGLNWLAKQRLIIKSRVRQSLAVIIPTSSKEVVNWPSNLVTQLAGQSVHMRWANNRQWWFDFIPHNPEDHSSAKWLSNLVTQLVGQSVVKSLESMTPQSTVESQSKPHQQPFRHQTHQPLLSTQDTV